MARIARLMPILAAVVIPSAVAANPPQVAFKQSSLDPAIVRLDQTGSGAVDLTHGKPIPSQFGAFSWAPDGSRLVYASRGIAGGDLYSVDGDGAGLTRLTANSTNDDPAWSPDGTRIAFVHTVRVPTGGGLYRLDQDIWLVGPDGSNLHALTHDAGVKYDEPRWSPDARRILYARLAPGGGFKTFVIDADTGAVVLQTADVGGRWSPDGSRIAVQSGSRIDVVDANGGGRRTVARNAGGPSWSPDGSRIAFVRTHCTRGLKGLCGSILKSVFVVGSDGQGERRLTGPISAGQGAQTEGFPNDDTSEPVWWPDGSRLFALHRNEAWLLNADGTCEQQFGPKNLDLGGPVWRPGAIPALPALTCIDLRVRTVSARDVIGRRATARIDVTVENDGNEMATGLEVRLRLTFGRGRIRPPFGSCRGGAVVECDLPPLGPGAAERFAVGVDRLGPLGPHFEARVSARETDSDPSTNTGVSFLNVLACDIVGTRGADVLAGTPRRDTICGLGGADRISGRGGNDRLSGDEGNDRIAPGPGRDVVFGGEGRDRIYARDGHRDEIDCGPGRDRVVADRVDKVARNCELVTVNRR